MDAQKSALSKNDEDTWKKFVEELDRTRYLKPPADIYGDVRSRKLDLHGHTLHSAWQVFNEFVDSHSTVGTKSVVIITGRSGQIGHEFKEWCRLSPHVRCYQPIVTKSGAAGSFRVMLKRRDAQR